MNGSNNGTLTHAILARESPAVELPQRTAQLPRRPARRQPLQFGNCDSGAYEFDGNTTADVPDCSPTGVIPLALDIRAGGDVVGLSYKVNSGAEIQNRHRRQRRSR